MPKKLHITSSAKMFTKASILLVLITLVYVQCSPAQKNQHLTKDPPILPAEHQEKQQPSKRQAPNHEVTIPELADAIALLLGKTNDTNEDTQSNLNSVLLNNILQDTKGQDKPLPKPSVPLPLKDLITAVWEHMKNENPKPNTSNGSYMKHVVEIGKKNEVLGTEEVDDGKSIQEVKYVVDSHGNKHIIRKTVRPTANMEVAPSELIDILILKNGQPQRVIITKDAFTGKYNVK